MGKHRHEKKGFKKKNNGKKESLTDCYIADLLSALQCLAVQRASKRKARYSDVVTLCSDDIPMMESNFM